MEISSLEQQYADLHHKLLIKINRLQYLQCRQQLKLQLEQQINTDYQHIQDTYSDIQRQDEPLEQLIQVQNEAFKTQDLLYRYLHVVVPTLRAVHQNQSTTTETLIHQHLQHMYGLESGTLKHLIQVNKELHQISSEVTTKRLQVNDMVKDLVIPKMESFHDDNQRLQVVKQRYRDFKEQLIQQHQLQYAAKETDIKTIINSLLKSWGHLSILCQLLPTLVSSLPINWATDKELLAIITQCETVLIALERNQQVISETSIRDMSYKDLLMIDFGELSMKLFTEKE